MPSLFKNLILMFLSAILALFLSEWGVRIFFPQRLTYHRENKYTINEDILGWTGRNKTKEYDVRLGFNLQGLRGPIIPYEKKAGVIRIMFLGDSFVEGAQVNLYDHFSRIVEHQLIQDQSSPDIEVINYGVAGWDNVQELIYLQNEGCKFKPDLLYLFVYPGNDINGNDGRFYAERLKNFINRTDLNILYRTSERNSPLLTMKEYLLSHSHLFTLIKIATAVSGMKEKWLGIQRSLGMINIPQRETTIHPISREQRIERSWKLFTFLMKRFRDYCRSNGIVFKVIVIPHITQIYPECHPEEFDKIIRKHWGNPGGYERVLRILLKLGISTTDLLPHMKSHQNDRLYFQTDFHWTPAGHRLVADILEPDIRKTLSELLNNAEKS